MAAKLSICKPRCQKFGQLWCSHQCRSKHWLGPAQPKRQVTSVQTVAQCFSHRSFNKTFLRVFMDYQICMFTLTRSCRKFHLTIRSYIRNRRSLIPSPLNGADPTEIPSSPGKGTFQKSKAMRKALFLLPGEGIGDKSLE